VQAAGRDDGEGRGVEAGAPLGAEAAGDLAEDDAGVQRALAGVVGGRHVTAGEEHEQVAPTAGDGAGEPASCPGGRQGGEQPIEAACSGSS